MVEHINFNKELILWCVGLLQPATASELHQFFIKVNPNSESDITLRSFLRELSKLLEDSCIFEVQKEPLVKYSLTRAGDSRISKKMRYNRDRYRLFLLKSARKKRYCVAGEDRKELAGDSPAVDERDGKQARRPVTSSAARVGRCYWPSLSEQLKLLAGPSTNSPATHLNLYSFSSWAQVRRANQIPANHNSAIFDLASVIGISPRLITHLVFAKRKHYRHFSIPKKSGGRRELAAPRVFLKTVQYWIVDHLFNDLPVHRTCHSFQRGKSIVSNASQHVEKNFVANIDIKDFFGSITDEVIKAHLVSVGFDKPIALLISQIVTLDHRLPQGAPTSPVLSNSILYEFDRSVYREASRRGCSYSRYADDITISGDDRKLLGGLIEYCSMRLKRYDLRLQTAKTRIASQVGRQVVTGLVVNRRPAPPRRYRRSIRAMFHQADLKPDTFKQKAGEMQGYIGYLESIPSLRNTKELGRYREILKTLQKT